MKLRVRKFLSPIHDALADYTAELGKVNHAESIGHAKTSADGRPYDKLYRLHDALISAAAQADPGTILMPKEVAENILGRLKA